LFLLGRYIFVTKEETSAYQILTMALKSSKARNRLAQRSSRVPRSSVSDTETETRNLPVSERDGLQVYMQEIGKTPLLKPAEEVDLAMRIKKGDRAARDQMIAANLRLVVKIAYDYNNFGLQLLDLISEGNIGLIKAVERFDPTKGGKLSTYAAWWIKQSIKRALANQSKTIRLPVHLVDRIANMRKITAKLADELDREPTDDEIAYTMGIPVNKVAHLKTVSVRPASLDAPVADDSDTRFGELVGDEDQATPLENLQEKTINGDIQTVLSCLDQREEEIIRLRFGLNGEAPLTLEEVGEHFDVTRERVRQIQNTALQKMRRLMTDNERQRSRAEILEEQIEKGRRDVFREFFALHEAIN
jgi:RNA polymerase primary sigma factor